jgi:hypothetical protein
MKIHSFNLQNWKKIENLESQINGSNVFIMAKNGKGKTSIIQALYCLATGKEIPSTPITTGKQTAKIAMQIGGESPEWNLELEFNEKHPKGKLSVTSTMPGAKPIKAARTFLDELIGGLLFDPFEFLSKTPAKQVEVFKELLGINFDVLENEYNEVFEARAIVNKDIVNIKGAISKMDVQPHEVKIFTEPKDIKEISDNLKKAETHNKLRTEKESQLLEKEKEFLKYQNAISELSTLDQNLTDSFNVFKAQIPNYDLITKAIEQIAYHTEGNTLKTKFKDFLEQISVVEKTMRDTKDRISSGEEVKAKTKAEIDELTSWLNSPENKEQSFADINSQYQSAVNFNAKCKIVAEYNTSMMEIDEKDMLSKEYTTRLKEILKEMATVVSTSKNNPIPLLSIDVENKRLLYDGLPLEEEQISKSKIYAIGIELMMAHNPKLRICRIKDGSLFDKEHLKETINWINEQDFQAFVEIVNDSEEVLIEFNEL